MLQVFIIVMRILNTYLYIIAQKKGLKETPFYYSVFIISTDGRSGQCNRSDSAAARSRGKLCAFLSCITSIPRLARFRTSAQVLRTRPCESITDWLKLKAVEVECHGGNTKCSEPDTDNRPCCEEEVQ
jgi:hypothetical protein